MITLLLCVIKSMYGTGTVSDINHRIHALANTTGDITQFVTEARGYLVASVVMVSGVLVSGTMPNISGKWEKELRMQKGRLTNNPSGFIAQHL